MRRKDQAEQCAHLLGEVYAAQKSSYIAVVGSAPSAFSALLGPNVAIGSTVDGVPAALCKRTKVPEVDIVLIAGTPKEMMKHASQLPSHAALSTCPAAVVVSSSSELLALEETGSNIFEDVLWSGLSDPIIVQRRIRKCIETHRLRQLACAKGRAVTKDAPSTEASGASSEGKNDAGEDWAARVFKLEKQLDAMKEYQEYLIWNLLRKYRFSMIPAIDEEGASPCASPSFGRKITLGKHPGLLLRMRIRHRPL